MASMVRAVRGVTPSAFLTLVNLAVAGLGFAQSLLVARLLGAAAFGVIGILTATSGVVANFLDLRVSDLTMKLYYPKLEEEDCADRTRYRRSLLQLSLLGSFGVSGLMIVMAIGLNVVLARHLVDRAVEFHWIVAAAFSGGLLFSGNTAYFLQRLSGRFHFIGAGRFVSQLLTTSAMVISVVLDTTLDGYFRGLLLGSFLGASVNLVMTSRVFKGLGIRLLDRGWQEALPQYRENVRFLIGTNAFGYTKMFHRAGDVLLMGAVAGDAVTGIYKLGRSIADSVNLLFDALNQVHFPSFLRILAADDLPGFKQRASMLLRRGLFWTPVILTVMAIVMPVAVDRILGSEFAALPATSLILVAPFAIIVGGHLWMWPVIVYENRVTRFVAFSAVGVLTQFATVFLLATLWTPRAVYGSVGFAAYYMVTYGASAAYLWKVDRDKMPRLLPTRGHHDAGIPGV